MKNAFSIIELLVVLAAIALMVVIAIPAITAMQKSFDSGGAESMISTALATARTLAIKNGHYVGVRFQKEYNAKGSLEANQYMIFVVYEPPRSEITLTTMFRAIEGYKPVKLPANIGVIDMLLRTDNRDDQYGPMNANANEKKIEEPNLNDSELERTLTDTSAFSIVFSPAGKLVVQDVRTRNKNGYYRPTTPALSDYDDVFNSLENITINNTGQFVQDDYAHYGLGGEQSRREFYIYDRQKFEKMTTAVQRWNYLNSLTALRINPYTGEIIKN